MPPPRISAPRPHDVGAFGEEGKVEQTQEARFGLQSALVMLEVKSVDAGLGLEARGSETPLNGALRARFDFHVGKPFQFSGFRLLVREQWRV